MIQLSESGFVLNHTNKGVVKPSIIKMHLKYQTSCVPTALNDIFTADAEGARLILIK